jgi:biotin transport system substrate-specific component
MSAIQAHTKSFRKRAILCATEIAIFVALDALCSQLRIPFAPVPLVLTQIGLLLGGGLLGPLWGTVATVLYVLLGAAGLPVFAGDGGLSKLLGPTGGFIWGYPLAALVAGLAVRRWGRKWYTMLPFCFLACAVIYPTGIFWLMRGSHLSFAQAMAAGCWPFLPGDAVKAILCALLIPRLQKAITSRHPLL